MKKTIFSITILIAMLGIFGFNTLESVYAFDEQTVIAIEEQETTSTELTQDEIDALFGDREWLQLDLNNADDALEYFKQKIRKYRSEVDSIEVKGEKNNRLYDLVFATNSKGMSNVLTDLKKRLDAIRTKDIKGLYSVVAEGQMQMEDYFKRRKH